MRIDDGLEKQVQRLLEKLGPDHSEIAKDLGELLLALVDTSNKYALLKYTIDQLPNEVYVKDTESRFIIANSATEHVNGAEKDGLIGKTDFDLFPVDEATRYRTGEVDVMETQRAVHYDPIGRRYPDGSPHWFRTSKYPVISADGAMIGICGFSQHATQSVQSEILLRSHISVMEAMVVNRPLRDVLQQICTLTEGQLPGFSSAIVMLDETGTHVSDVISPSLPDAYCKSTLGAEIGADFGSCGAACHSGKPVYVADVATDQCWMHLKKHVEPLNQRGCWSAPFFNKDGSVRGTFSLYSSASRQPVEFEKQLMALAVRLVEIVLERDSAAREIEQMAARDILTGLLNRSSFGKHFDEALSLAASDGQSLALAFIDFDDFKLVNDTYGHDAGDDFLRVVGQRLAEAAVREHATVARLGGDEFVAVFKDMGVDNYRERLSGLLRAISAPIQNERYTLNIRASAGVALYPQHGSDSRTLLANADAAMYKAKQNRLGSIETFDPAISLGHRDQRLRTDELRNAIEKGEIDIDLQPIFSLPQGDLFAFEALARWNHPLRGRLNASEFIPIAEETGLVVALGEAVLLKACIAAQRWRKAFGSGIVVSVNVSAHQFRQGEIVRQVRAALDASGLPPALLELELTETVLLEDEPLAIGLMSELKSIGVGIAIDDFGTGFSNLSALARFPLDCMKIDRSIIQDIPDNESLASIASAIIVLGRKLGVRVLAEGVETQSQFEFLLQSNCDCIQGYLVGRPGPCTLAEHLIASGAKARLA